MIHLPPECGVNQPLNLLGTITVLRAIEKAPVIFLIDETHEESCIKQNVSNATELVGKCGIKLVGVESLYGGFVWDDVIHRGYTEGFEQGDRLEPANNFPQFADALRKLDVPVVGLECQGLANALESDCVDNPGPPIGDRPLNLERSRHFVRTLFEIATQRNLTGNMILNAGGNHNTHIATWVADGSIDSMVPVVASYVRLRPPLYRAEPTGKVFAA